MTADQLRQQIAAMAARLDRAADAKFASLLSGGTAVSIASVVYELRAFARELRNLAEVKS